MIQQVSESGYNYFTEIFRRRLSVKDYLSEYMDSDGCTKACKNCLQYGKRWGCPPFEFVPEELLGKYQYVEIVAVKIIPEEKNLPLSMYDEFLTPVKTGLENELLEEEKKVQGLVCGHVGKCIYCGDMPCTRAEGKPCRHPEKIRPSLESLGFNVTKTLKEIFGVEILWGKNERMPEYLILVCALFHGKRCH